MNREPDQAAPKNWIMLVTDRCDLDLAFEALEGWEHFHTDTIRGRIRSLQLRPDEAWDHFENAQKRSESYGSSLRNVLRRFYLKIYRFENALIEESGSDAGDPSKMEDCLRALLCGETPDAEIARTLNLFSKGLCRLHREKYAEAKKIFHKLLQESRDRLGDEKAGFYLGAAVAHRGLGEEEESDRQIENASLFIPALDNAFNMGYYAGALAALLRIWDKEEEASEWDAFIQRLKIPPKTIRLFEERSRRIVERSLKLDRVFLF
jgi:tetratricopeptide (TPR) repeat protein